MQYASLVLKRSMIHEKDPNIEPTCNIILKLMDQIMFKSMQMLEDPQSNPMFDMIMANIQRVSQSACSHHRVTLKLTHRGNMSKKHVPTSVEETCSTCSKKCQHKINVLMMK
mgnify:CR=1 FL=1